MSSHNYPVKLLNIGCGSRPTKGQNVINIDYSPLARIKNSAILKAISYFFVTGDRKKRLISYPGNITVYDIRKGLPFPTGSIEAVYHSHLLEHLDREMAKSFLSEVVRVLTPGGLHRIAVPDMEQKCTAYLNSLMRCRNHPELAQQHEYHIASIIEQCVRRESASSRAQSPLRRWLENLLLGDARKRGETHQWMYDRITLSQLLESTGHRNIRVMKHTYSDISGWQDYAIESKEDGSLYRPNSLIIEAEIPGD